MRSADWNNLFKELKPNPIIEFNEKYDSTIEISLPNEWSLISLNDSWLLRDKDSLITFNQS